jgi:NADH dehydrogenase
MSDQVVVLGSGYAGAGTVQSLEHSLGDEAEVTWVSDVDYHLVLHESHRCIRDPSVREHVTIPIEEVKSPGTRFVQGRVTGLDTERRVVELAEGELDYDYVLVGVGSRTAFFGIDGLREHAHTLKGLDDALAIHDDLERAANEATVDDPAQVIVGGAGLTGIQVAGEIAEFRDERDAPVEIRLIEGLDEVFPDNDPSVQSALRSLLEERDVEITTGEFIGSVDEQQAHIAENGHYDYDVLVWTGGISGCEELADCEVQKDDRNLRFEVDRTFQSSDERVFAIGDAALVEQGEDDHAPPTAQAAWQAAEVAGENIARAIRDQPLEEWRYKNKGTVVSVGEDAVAHDIFIVPFVSTFGGILAQTLKKTIAVRWIRDLTDTGTAMAAWSKM